MLSKQELREAVKLTIIGIDNGNWYDQKTDSIMGLAKEHTNAEIAKVLDRLEESTPDYSEMDSYNRSFLKAMYENTIVKAIEAERKRLNATRS